MRHFKFYIASRACAGTRKYDGCTAKSRLFFIFALCFAVIFLATIQSYAAAAANDTTNTENAAQQPVTSSGQQNGTSENTDNATDAESSPNVEAQAGAGEDSADENDSDSSANDAVKENNSGAESTDSRTTDAESTESRTAGADPQIQAKSAILMDADSGTILYEMNSHKELPPASVTKVMTMLLIMEAIDSGRISFDDQVTISETAASMGGSQLYMEPGETHTVDELLTGISMVSANDACVAMAEFISGTDEIFVEKMNEKAASLGLENTHFSNTNGLPTADHYSSAHDIAVISQALLSHPAILPYLSNESGTIQVGKEGHTSTIEMINTNKLLKTYNGAMGIKTGFTQDAGYCLSSYAERDDLRLIAVVLGAESSKIRFSESARLLDYGFANYESVKIADKNEIIGTANVDKGLINAVDIKTDEKIVLLVKKGEASSISYHIRPAKNLKAPVKENDKAGTLEITKDDELIKEYTLTASADVGKADLKTLMIRSTEMILK